MLGIKYYACMQGKIKRDAYSTYIQKKKKVLFLCRLKLRQLKILVF